MIEDPTDPKIPICQLVDEILLLKEEISLLKAFLADFMNSATAEEIGPE